MIERAAAYGWEIVEHHYRGEHRGTAALRGTEIHFEVLKSPAILRSAAREFLRPLLERQGFLTTRCEIGDAASQRFIERMGFRRTWSSDEHHFFMLTELPFGKGAPCP